MNYLEEFSEQAKKAMKALAEKEIFEDLLQDSFIDEDVLCKTRIPTDAKSEFLANRALGDWAENILANAIAEAQKNWNVSRYGFSDSIAAGDPGFGDFYIKQKMDVNKWGKRPDLLVFHESVRVEEDLSLKSTESLLPYVRQALFSVEVRSSKLEAQTYLKVKSERKAGKPLTASEVPSITVKIEDLQIVCKWIRIHQAQQIYAQVFLDSVYAINVVEILRKIGTGKGYRIIKPAKSQGKPTIMIPITSAVRIDNVMEVPSFEARVKRTELGRHDAYVVPVGGKLSVNAKVLKSIL